MESKKKYLPAPEWDASTAYSKSAVCTIMGIEYVSAIDGNIGLVPHHGQEVIVDGEIKLAWKKMT